MTTIYFVRHCEPDRSAGNDRTFPLTSKGSKDCKLVTQFLSDKHIDIILSSPFKRAYDTVLDFARSVGKEIEVIEDFRECGIANGWIDVLGRYKGKNIAAGTHGTALSAMIRYYDDTYSFDEWDIMPMPWIVQMDFDDNGCVGMEKFDLFHPDQPHDYSRMIVRTLPLGTLKSYRYTVIFARYNDKWLYCRHRHRDVYETAGGHVEPGETMPEAAKRELFEETGAVKFDIKPVFDYAIHLPTVYSNGQVFLAEIHELGDMPGFEMAEVRLFDTIPDKMRLPGALPALFNYLQAWLNLQTAKDEIWDVYDAGRHLTGRTHRRIDPLPPGDYHLIVLIWLQNSNDEFLITKRAPNKGFPNMWECTGGSAVAGDNSLTAAIREVKEETGLAALPENGRLVTTYRSNDAFWDIWLFRQDFDLDDVVLQEGETIDAKYATADQICTMIRNNKFVPDQEEMRFEDFISLI